MLCIVLDVLCGVAASEWSYLIKLKASVLSCSAVPGDEHFVVNLVSSCWQLAKFLGVDMF